MTYYQGKLITFQNFLLHVLVVLWFLPMHLLSYLIFHSPLPLLCSHGCMVNQNKERLQASDLQRALTINLKTVYYFKTVFILWFPDVTICLVKNLDYVCLKHFTSVFRFALHCHECAINDIDVFHFIIPNKSSSDKRLERVTWLLTDIKKMRRQGNMGGIDCWYIKNSFIVGSVLNIKYCFTIYCCQMIVLYCIYFNLFQDWSLYQIDFTFCKYLFFFTWVSYLLMILVTFYCNVGYWVGSGLFFVSLLWFPLHCQSFKTCYQ